MPSFAVELSSTMVTNDALPVDAINSFIVEQDGHHPRFRNASARANDEPYPACHTANSNKVIVRTVFGKHLQEALKRIHQLLCPLANYLLARQRKPCHFEGGHNLISFRIKTTWDGLQRGFFSLRRSWQNTPVRVPPSSFRPWP